MKGWVFFILLCTSLAAGNFATAGLVLALFCFNAALD